MVGQEQQSFNIHEALIRSRSDFFDAALSKRWKEGRENYMELPEDSPEIVQCYFQFLYTGQVFIKWTRDCSKMSANENLPEYLTLAHLYVLGEKVHDIAFKNAVMDAFVLRMTEPVGPRLWSPVTDVADVIYEGTMPEKLSSAPERAVPRRCVAIGTNASPARSSYIVSTRIVLIEPSYMSAA